jgi:hypothetical protein
MSTFEEAQERDMILFVGSYLKSQREAMDKLSSSLQKKLTACVLLDVVGKDEHTGVTKDPKAKVIFCDLSSKLATQKALAPYKHRYLPCREECADAQDCNSACPIPQ